MLTHEWHQSKFQTIRLLTGRRRRKLKEERRTLSHQLIKQANPIRPGIDNSYILHNILDFEQNFGTYINSSYVVTLWVNLLTKLWLNLSRIQQINRKNNTEEERHFFQRPGQQQRRTSSVSDQTLILMTGLSIQQFFRHE